MKYDYAYMTPEGILGNEIIKEVAKHGYHGYHFNNGIFECEVCYNAGNTQSHWMSEIKVLHPKEFEKQYHIRKGYNDMEAIDGRADELYYREDWNRKQLRSKIQKAIKNGLEKLGYDSYDYDLLLDGDDGKTISLRIII